MNEEMQLAWLEISDMLGEPTREELDVFLRTWQRASQATRKALAEQPAQQEPVALVEKFSLLLWDYQELERAFEKATGGKWVRKSNTPQRTWVGLTDGEIYSVLENLQVMHHRPSTTDSRVIFALAVEAKLKEKNT